MIKHIDIISDLKKKSDDRYNSFRIEEVDSISSIRDDAYLENPTWLGGNNEFVCLFIDLDQSSKMSFKKHPQTMAKIYDYFTQNIVNIMSDYSEFRADYIDIKGDGAFGIYEGANATYRAFCAAITFRTFFENVVKPKFSTNEEQLNCKLAIAKDKILVKKIGKKGDRNNNEVWAGRVVNNASKLGSLSKDIYALDKVMVPKNRSLLVVSEKVYTELNQKSDQAIISCGHKENGEIGIKMNVWSKFDCSNNDEIHGDSAYYTSALWCRICADNFIHKLTN